MRLLRRARNAVRTLREAWRVARAPANAAIARELVALVDTAGAPGVRSYLRDYPARGRVAVLEDWSFHPPSGEVRLTYSNSLFAPGCLRIRPGRRDGGLIVFLPGYQDGAEDVLGRGRHPQNMTAVADELGIGVAAWDWLLQGARRDGCLYRGLGSVYSAEREYSRILPALGTSLWREAVAELDFALRQVRRYVGPGALVHVVGWSMGGCFAYLAPLLGTEVATTISAGSCARVKDLAAEGKTRLHGYFFYPLNGVAYFDLDDVVAEVLAEAHPFWIIHGERDAGCLERTRQALADRGRRLARPLQIDVLPGHGHAFSPAIKRRIVAVLRGHGTLARGAVSLARGRRASRKSDEPPY
jgi:dienelactone hydrolase